MKIKFFYNNFYGLQGFIRSLFKITFVAVCILATGCAHKINITPATSQLEAVKLPRIKKNVGYYISPENLKKRVVSPAGGGDKVAYFPYKESEPILKAILSNIFINVYQISSLEKLQFIDSHNITYIFIPTIETNSSSRSIWIWPPSDFTARLDCKVTDSSREMVWKTTVNSEAHMGLPEVSNDHSLAGKVAISKAFSKLQHEIHEKFYHASDDQYYPPKNSVDSVDSFDEGNDGYYSPQDQQKLVEPKSTIDSFDIGDEYYSPDD